MNEFKLKCLTILICISGLYLLSGCEQDFVTPAAGEFPDEIQSIFNTSLNSTGITCASSNCHNSTNPSTGSGLNLTSFASALEGSANGTMIIPYNAFYSHLTAIINSDTNISPVVPLGQLDALHKLDTGKVNTIMNWINAGAPNKDGVVAFTPSSINPKGFITNQSSDLTALIYPYNNKFLVTRLIPVGGRSTSLDAPHFIEFSPTKQHYYVSLIQEGYIEKYNSDNDYPFGHNGRFAAGNNPAHIEISNDGVFGYYTNFDASGIERRVKKFDAINMTVLDTAESVNMNAPHGMALTSDGFILYVAAQIGEYLFKISTSTMQILLEDRVDPSVPPGGNGTNNFRPYQIVLSPDEQYLFVSFNGPNSGTGNDQVRVFNTSNLSFVKDITVGNYPLLMKITPDGRYLFVCNRNKNANNQYTVSIIDVASQTLAATVTDVGVQPHGVDFTTDGQYAIIACETREGSDGHHPTTGSKTPGVSRVIRVNGFQLLPDRIEMGSFPAGIVFNR